MMRKNHEIHEMVFGSVQSSIVLKLLGMVE